MEIQDSFIYLIEQSIRTNWDRDALTDYKGATLQYKDVARKIEKMHILFRHGDDTTLARPSLISISVMPSGPSKLCTPSSDRE